MRSDAARRRREDRHETDRERSRPPDDIEREVWDLIRSEKVKEALATLSAGERALTPNRMMAPLEDVFPHSKLALLVGSEGGGLTPEAMRAATIRIRIPMTSDVDSLNVTTAASIAMYHCFAERRG